MAGSYFRPLTLTLPPPAACVRSGWHFEVEIFSTLGLRPLRANRKMNRNSYKKAFFTYYQIELICLSKITVNIENFSIKMHLKFRKILVEMIIFHFLEIVSKFLQILNETSVF